MPSLKSRLLGYLESLTGEHPDLVVETPPALPLFLKERFRFCSVRLFGRRFLLALETEDWDAGSPGEYEKQAAALRSQVGEPVVLVLPNISSSTRDRLVRLGVPFIVPGSQMFLPTALIDLRERFSPPRPESGKRLTPAAQGVVLYHLQRQPMENLPLRDIAAKVGYSPVMLTKVKDELEAAEICQSSRQGRSIVLQFVAHGQDLWQRVAPLLSTPVKKTLWLRWETPAYPALTAGLSALSRRTMIADDRLPTFAMVSTNVLANLEHGLFRGCPEPGDANVRMESWSYNPLLLGTNETVDPLSLFLSLRDLPDERVQQQLETLLDDFPW